MGVRPGRCHACGETAARTARFCGRCGAHLAAAHTGAAGSRPTVAQADVATASDGAGARRPAWWLTAGVAAVVVGVAAAGLTGGLTDASGEGDDVDLPDEDAIETDADPGPEGAAPMAPADAEFDCLVDEPCVRWRSDVDGLLDDRTQAHVASVGGHTLLVRTTDGVAGLDLAGRVRWSRMTSDGEALSTTRMLTVTDEHVVLATRQGRLHVLEVRTGEHRWTAEQPPPDEPDGDADREASTPDPGPGAVGRQDDEHLHLTNARQYEDVLLLAFQEPWRSAEEPMPAHHLVAYGLDDGTLRWQRRAAHATLVDGMVVAATEAGVAGLDPRTGGVRWTEELEGAEPATPPDARGDEPPPMPHQTTTPAGVLGGRVVAVPVPTGVVVETVLLDPATGRERARLEGSPLPHAIAGHGDDDRLVLRRGEGGSELVAVDAHGRIQWEQHTDVDPTSGSRSHTSSIAGDVFVRTETTTDTHLLVIDLADGRVLHEEQLQHDRRVHPGALGRRTLLLHDEEEATAVDLIDGTELWRVRHTFPYGGALSDAVLLQVGHELLAVEHDPRAARREVRGR